MIRSKQKPKRVHKGHWFILLFLFWGVLIFLFSSQSYEEQSIIPFLQQHIDIAWARRVFPDIHITYMDTVYSPWHDPYRFIEFLFRKSAHLFMYASLAVIAFAMVYKFSRRLWLSALLPIVIAAAVAAADEWNQSLSSERTSSIYDVLIDVTGASLGIVVCLIVTVILSAMKSSRNSL
ncbi:VanZ family protein [Paenibacillus spongiae]|uniref:VanZ family protein n=1 Tax=Paenibacillus spongiae TaxID=2909671 RepID=A0ABY5SCD3_9BACL|nr:VanZ family protein [Paenibacillus spongiae]UVI31616.1 VanZ family protein [Paenibacillus spongiae]